MNIKDRIRIFDYVKKTISNNTKPRLFIELDIPCSKTSDDYGWFMFDISLEITDLGYDCICINPTGASHTVVHLFIFSSSEDKKVLDIFNSGTSVPYEQLKEDVKDIPLEYECDTKELKI